MPFLTRSSTSETSGSASSRSHVDVWGAGHAGGKEGPAGTGCNPEVASPGDWLGHRHAALARPIPAGPGEDSCPSVCAVRGVDLLGNAERPPGRSGNRSQAPTRWRQGGTASCRDLLVRAAFMGIRRAHFFFFLLSLFLLFSENWDAFRAFRS